jgi:hypothetical protein
VIWRGQPSLHSDVRKLSSLVHAPRGAGDKALELTRMPLPWALCAAVGHSPSSPLSVGCGAKAWGSTDGTSPCSTCYGHGFLRS